MQIVVLKHVLRRPILAGDCPKGLWEGIERATRPHDKPEPHPIWTEAEIAAVMDAGAPGLTRALATYCRQASRIKLTDTAMAKVIDMDQAHVAALRGKAENG